MRKPVPYFFRPFTLLLWSAAAAVLLAAWPQNGFAEPVPVADFFRRPALTDVVMSPNGKSIAGAMAAKNGRMQLVILDLLDLSRSKIVAAFQDADIQRIRWVNDDRLVFSVNNREVAYADQRGSGLFAVSRDGSDAPRRLIETQWALFKAATNVVDRTLPANHSLHSTLRDGSDDVLVERWMFSPSGEYQGSNLLRLNTRTGISTNLSAGAPEHAVHWAADTTGAPRAVVSQWDGKTRLFWKASPDASWKQVQEYPTFEAGHQEVLPLYIGSDGLVLARGYADRQSDTSSLLRVDFSSGSVASSTLLHIDGYDYVGAIEIGSQHRLLGVRYLSDAWSTYWFDPDLKKLQARVDALLPGTVNLLSCGACRDPVSVLVTSSSDRQPTVFRLFDPKTDALSDIGRQRPWINPAQMARRDMVRITARDGLSIPVHVTVPQGPKSAMPTVVLVHGGPWVRGGEWNWDAESQFLASRGYVVIEPEFRGSTGFGNRLARAGDKQWGLAMQDDVADAALWAIKEGYADPKRVCIAGASYGGYATLMGLIRNPEIFRCGVEWAGVTDIDLMYSISWSDASEQYKTFGMPVLVGDRVKDAAQFAATSPIRLAGRIKQPLLMAHGGVDRRVPLEHATQFRDAVGSKNVEWILYEKEGHGWTLEANDVDFWTRVDRFLDRNLKNAP